MSKRFLSLVALAALFVGVLPASAGFNDVDSSHQNSDAIDYVERNGIVRGYPDGNYRPDTNINRVEFTKIIVEAVMEVDTSDISLKNLSFSDLLSGQWYNPYVRAAVDAGIVAGYADATFKPENEINFAEAAKIIVKGFDYHVETDSEIWYRPYVEVLSDLGAIPTSLDSLNDTVTRGDMAEMIYRILVGVRDKDSRTYSELAVAFSDYEILEDDDYSSSPDGPTVVVQLDHTDTHSMNDYLGFPEGNTLKMHSTCYDDDLDRGFAAGIMTSELAVYEDDEVIEYLETDVGTGDFVIKDLFCGGGVLFMATDELVMKIDGESLEIDETIYPSDGLFYSNFVLAEDAGWFSFPVVTDDPYRSVYDVDTMESRGDIEIDKSKLFPMDDGTILAVELLNDDDEYPLTFYDEDSLEEVDLATIEAQNLLADGAAYDDDEEELWILAGDALYVYDLDSYELVDEMETIPDAHDVQYGDGKIVVLTENGFDDGTVGDFLGGVEIIDAESRESEHIVEVPSHHTSLDLDARDGEAFITNNGDNSVTKIDLDDGDTETIPLGSSTEGGVVASDGTLYLRSRLGGSAVMHLDPDSEDFEHIETPYAWPMWIDYSENLDRVLTFDFLNSSISLLDPDSNEFETTYDLGIPEGSTDGVGHMTYDYTRDIAYAALPEQNRVVAFDVEGGAPIAVIELEDYLDDGEYDELSGPGTLVLGVHEPTSKLFVYAVKAETIFVYDGLNDFELVAEIEDDKDLGIKTYSYSLEIDSANDRLYLGEHIYDVQTYEYLGDLEHGNAVAAIDAERGILLTVGYESDSGEETLYALSMSGDLLDEVDLNEDQYVKSRFTYDQNGGVLYVMYMVPSEVWAIEVF